MNKFRYILLIACFAITSHAKLLKDEAMIQKTLPNGFSYTIKKNHKPKETAVFKLLVEVGSLDEDDDQKGIAHLIEHLAFNGSEHFSGNDLIKFLESIGVSFGSHLNASTSYMQTIYQLTVPIKNNNISNALIIFGDWANKIKFTKKELDKERGVVLEEARARNDVNFRLGRKSDKAYFGNSKYTFRTPIGDENIIKNIKLKRVRDFYDTWYRPEFMHFIAIGDFDVKKMEKLIIKTFGDIKNTSKRKKVTRDVEDINKTRILFLKDKELISSSITLDFIKKASTKITTKEEYKTQIIKSVMARLFNEKASIQLIKKNPAANLIRLSIGKIGMNLQRFSFFAKYTGLKEIPALEELTNFIFSVEKFGFSQEELERTIKAMKKQDQEYLKKKNNRDSNMLSNMLLRDIIHENISMGVEYEINIREKILNSITLKDVNEMYKSIFLTNNRVLAYKMANNSSISKRKVKSILKNARKKIKEEKSEEKLPKRIKIANLSPAKITDTKYNKKFDFYEFRLSNGIKIVYKFNDYDKNLVRMLAFSNGGFSLKDTKLLPSARYASSIIGKSGFDKYNTLEVAKIYSDKTITVNPQIGRYEELLNGVSSKNDFEYLFERVYLLSKKFKCDENILANSKQMAIARLKKINKNPNMKFSRKLINYLYDGNKRFTFMKQEDIKSINKKDLIKVYKDRFSDFNNFTFVIVGDISKEKVEKYAKLYLGNLPTNKRKETYNFRNIKPKKGMQKFIKNFNNENISSIGIKYTKELPYSQKDDVILSVFSDVLKVKLREFIREEKSGVYGISVGNFFTQKPYSKSDIMIRFSCNPKRKDEIVKYVKKIIAEIKQKPVKQKLILSSIKKQKIALKKNKKRATFWMSHFKNHYDLNNSLDIINQYEKIYDSINPKVLKEIANKYLSTKDILYTELNPK